MQLSGDADNLSYHQKDFGNPFIRSLFDLLKDQFPLWTELPKPKYAFTTIVRESGAIFTCIIKSQPAASSFNSQMFIHK